MKKLTLWLLLALWGVATLFSYYYGKEVRFSEQWPLFEALRTTSAIIFAVVGAWLAIVYPERLRLSIKSDGGASLHPKQNNIGILLSPVVNSTAVLCIVLLVGVVAPLMKRSEYVLLHIAEFRGGSYALLTALTLWQAWTVILTLIPADLILSNSNRENLKKSVLEGMRRTSINRSRTEND